MIKDEIDEFVILNGEEKDEQSAICSQEHKLLSKISLTA